MSFYTIEGVISIEKVLRIIEKNGRDIRICYNIFNPIRFGYGYPLQELGMTPVEKLRPIHLKDGAENMIGCTLLGEGVGKFFEVAEAIKTKGYTGWHFAETYYYKAPLKGSEDRLTMLCRYNDTMRSITWNGTSL